MADQDQTPTEPTEISTDVTETDLEKVVGGLPILGIEGESTHQDHKGSVHLAP